MTQPDMPSTPVPQTGATDLIIKKLEDLERKQETGFANVSRDIGLLGGEVGTLRERIATAERRLDENDGRANRNSDRVKSQSEIDTQQFNLITQEQKARADLSEKVDALGHKIETATAAQTAAIVSAIKDAVKTPLGRVIVAALVALITGWLAAKGIRVNP
jgi:Skp family chaperone for outer membrane proteins